MYTVERPHQHACSPTNIWTKRSTSHTTIVAMSTKQLSEVHSKYFSCKQKQVFSCKQKQVFGCRQSQVFGCKQTQAFSINISKGDQTACSASKIWTKRSTCHTTIVAMSTKQLSKVHWKYIYCNIYKVWLQQLFCYNQKYVQ